MPRTFLTFVIIAILLTACGLVSPTPPPTFIPSATLTTPNPTPSPTGTAIATPTPTESGVQVDVVEENIPAVSTYVFEKIIYPINEGGKYFEELGIKTIDDFRRVIVENSNHLPASKAGNVILVPSLAAPGSTTLEIKGAKMDKPLSATIDVQFSSDENEQVKNKSIPVFWWGSEDNNLLDNETVFIFSGLSPNNSENQFQVKLHWKNQRFDLFGKSIKNSEEITSEDIAFQADMLIRGFLLFETGFIKSENHVISKEFRSDWYSNLDDKGNVGSIFCGRFFREFVNSKLWDNTNLTESMPLQLFSIRNSTTTPEATAQPQVKTVDLVNTKGETVTFLEAQSQQEAIDLLAKLGVVETGDRNRAIDYITSFDNPDAAEFFPKISKIPGIKPFISTTLRTSSGDFIVVNISKFMTTTDIIISFQAKSGPPLQGILLKNGQGSCFMQSACEIPSIE